jgi:hypothetical protein
VRLLAHKSWETADERGLYRKGWRKGIEERTGRNGEKEWKKGGEKGRREGMEGREIRKKFVRSITTTISHPSFATLLEVTIRSRNADICFDSF